MSSQSCIGVRREFRNSDNPDATVAPPPAAPSPPHAPDAKTPGSGHARPRRSRVAGRGTPWPRATSNRNAALISPSRSGPEIHRPFNRVAAHRHLRAGRTPRRARDNGRSFTPPNILGAVRNHAPTFGTAGTAPSRPRLSRDLASMQPNSREPRRLFRSKPMETQSRSVPALRNHRTRGLHGAWRCA